MLSTPIKKNTRAHIKIAALNINGQGGTSLRDPNNKWNQIPSLMCRKKLGALVVGESHLSPEDLENLNTKYMNRIKLFNSPHPERARGRAGIAVILNKEITNTEDVTTQVLIPGHAMLLRLPWHGKHILTILAIYAPNESTAINKAFWEELRCLWINLDIPIPDLILGDMNVVEDAIDRLPSNHHDRAAATALDNLKTLLGLTDGWRDTFPTTKAYTFHQKATGHRSRIDRIYAGQEIMKQCHGWTIEDSGIETDHDLISTEIRFRNAPYIGKGRWSMPLYILKDKVYAQQVHEAGLKLQEELERTKNARTSTVNPQTLLRNFKDEIVLLARERCKILSGKLDKDI
ncbi:DNase I-like protein, partial [Armillaria solidipes]